MRHFNFFAVILLGVASSLPDLLSLLQTYALKNHLVPYEFRSYVEFLYSVPWASLVFGLVFAPCAKIAFPNSTKIRFDEVAGFVLIAPLLQFLVPMLVGFGGKYLELFKLPVVVVSMGMYAILLATIARGILGLEALGLLSTILVGLVGAGVVALALVPDLPGNPAQLWYFFVGTTMAVICARTMD